MDLISILLMAVGLALDATAVSAAYGMQMYCFHLKPALVMAFLFGGFQMIMPLTGWFLGRVFSKLVAAFDHWIAFALLLLIGLKMIFEKKEKECKFSEEEAKAGKMQLAFLTLLALAVSTSIDAFAVGITFSLLKMELFWPIMIIGAVTFLLSFLGVLAGQKLSNLLRLRIEVLGGVILIVIGLKILLEHLFF